MSNKKQHKTSIGGQALIEGIMMKGPKGTAMSVRLPDGTIDTELEYIAAKIAVIKINRQNTEGHSRPCAESQVYWHCPVQGI